MEDHLCGFFYRCDVVSRDVLTDLFEIFFTKLGIHLSVDHTKGNGIYLDIAGSNFLCKGLGQSVDPPFAVE